jgi:hypothetical protein
MNNDASMNKIKKFLSRILIKLRHLVPIPVPVMHVAVPVNLVEYFWYSNTGN